VPLPNWAQRPQFHLEGDRLRFTEFMLAATVTSAPTTEPAAWWFPFVNNPILLIAGGLMIFMLFSGKNKTRGEEKQRQEMLKQLKRGDRIQTAGGIQGAVTRVEENRVEVKVDESSNTKIWFSRGSIFKVIESSDKEKGDKADAK
jgi:preprotein translocase subunit YajC